MSSHNKNIFPCEYCDKYFLHKRSLKRHQMNKHKYEEEIDNDFLASYMLKPSYISYRHEFDFKWAIITALMTSTRPNLKNINMSLEMITLSNGAVINFTGMKFPMSKPQDISYFEELNPDICTDVYTIDSDSIDCIYKSSFQERKRKINLIYHEKTFYWFKNIFKCRSMFIKGTLNSKFLCNSCNFYSLNEESLACHKLQCF